MLGWTAKGAEANVESGSLKITGAAGRQSLLVNSKLRITGPAELKLRVRAKSDGTGRLQWRTVDQELFPKTGQDQSFKITGGDWQELSVPLAIEAQVVHLRFFPPKKKSALEIDWIEIKPAQGKPERWDFDASTKKQ